MNIRPIEDRDRPRLAEIIQNAGNFSAEEVVTALELIDEAIKDGNRGDYNVYVVEDARGVHGYICIGLAPLTVGTYDLYWIVVDAVSQGKGYGQRLLRYAEEEIGRRGGRMLLIETSSMDSYKASRKFYTRAGYEEIARLPNYYKPGDDKVVYARTVSESSS